MKLRNKKTGEIWETAVVNSYACGAGYRLLVTKDAYTQVGKHYNSLAELNEDWEDYKPAEPLIKDEKVRKAVRAWGDMNQIRKAAIQRIMVEPRGFEDSWFQITGEDANKCIWKIEIHAPYSETVSKDYKEKMVTIDELCGEEEEC
jgi:hypothetical protein